MKRSKKRQFHCQRCTLPCEIYKKGRNHRVLVCPQCGVLATNPFSFGGALGGAATGAAVGSAIPLVGTAAGGIIGGAIGGLSRSKKPKARDQEQADTTPPRVYRDTYSTEERVHDALL